MSSRISRTPSLDRSLSSRRRRRSCQRFAPALLPLETRALLSTLTVTNDNDSGTGSLRYELGLANAGDTINFSPKAYGTITLTGSPLQVPNGVDVNGPGPGEVTVSGDNKSTVFEIGRGVTASISGLTITDGVASVVNSYGFVAGGGGIYSLGNLTLSDCVVTGNSALSTSPSFVTGGGGIFSNAVPYAPGTLTINDCTITGNTASVGGGIETGGPLTVTDSSISDNQGTGIYDFGSNASLTRSHVDGNAGQGIFVDGLGPSPVPTLTLTDSSVSGNSVTTGQALGAGIQTIEANVTISGSVLADNVASSQLSLGGAIHMTGSFFGSTPGADILTVTDSTFIGNQALAPNGTSGGGAIFTDPGAIISLTATRFINNLSSSSSETAGGALNLNQVAKGTIADCQFSGNQAVVPATTTFLGSSATGGAILNQGQGGALSITGSTFAGNQAFAGGASGFGIGGAILNQSESVVALADSLLMNNSAIGGNATSSDGYGGFGVGGGLVNQFGATATVTDSTFLGNRAVGGSSAQPGGTAGPAWGGAIMSGYGSTLTLSGGLIAGNAALGGDGSNGATGGIAQGGGVYSAYGSKLQASGTAVLLNTAIGGSGGGNGEGGGVFVSGSGASASLTDMLITLNSAIGGSGGGNGYGGGLYIGTGAITTLKNTRVVANDASTGGDNIYGSYTIE
ncbi:MAG: beta strand repeat-containing protein [Isosphaeraceae bacterium]